MPDVEDGQYQTVGDHTSTVGHTSQCGEAVTHYSMLADMLVELSLAVRNPQFDPAVEYSEAVKITKPERLFSTNPPTGNQVEGSPLVLDTKVIVNRSEMEERLP